MGLFKWFLGYGAAKHLLKATRPRPVTIRLHVELPDENDEDDEGGGPSPCPGDGIYVWDGGAAPPRFFGRGGEETDEQGSPL